MDDAARWMAVANGESYEIGPDEPAKQWSPTWTAKRILYYHINFRSGVHLNFEYDLNVSGLKKGSNFTEADVENFATGLVAGPAAGLTRFKADAEVGPHLRVTHPCYVVIELNRRNRFWSFLPEAPALKTTGTRLTDRYTGLVHVGDNGNRYRNAAPVLDETRCRIVYFAVRDPRTPTGNDKADADPFNLYLLFDQADGKALPMVLDPDIKNRGGENFYA